MVIILDSVDQLSRSFHAFSLGWFPWQLPPHVYFIVSVITTKQNVMKKLSQNIKSSNFLEVPALGENLGYDVIQLWLKQAGRKLTSSQNEIVHGVLEKCSLPLYTKLIFEEVVKWPSYLLDEKILLPECIRDVINMLFQKTEVRHGKVLVSHALSYITASRNGLSEAELEDVLSLDDEVLDEVFTFWLPPIRRLPPLLWTRIREDLHSYLVTRDANGVTVLAWYHRQFWEGANERYLNNKASKRQFHSMLADYFMGVWSGVHKPFKFNDFLMKRYNYSSPQSQADRRVPSQPLSWLGSDGQVRYNFRKLSEMPYNLYYSDRLEEMWKYTVFNYEWINARVRAKTLPEMLSDISLAKSAQLDSKFGLLASALKMACDSLSKLPRTLGPELIARLKDYAQSSGEIEQLVKQAETRCYSDCALLPLFQCFQTPIDTLISSIEGHSQRITDLKFSQDSLNLYSLSEAGHLAVWDVASGERLLQVDLSTYPVHRQAELFVTNDAIVCELYEYGTPLISIDPTDGQVKLKLGEHRTGYIHETVVGHEVAIRDGHMYNLKEGRDVKMLEFLSKCKDYVTLAITPDDSCALIGDKNTVSMYELQSEKCLMKLHCDTVASAIVVTKDCRTAIVGFTINCLIKVLNIDVGSPDFGHMLFEFDFKSYFANQEFQSGERYSQEVSELVLSPDCQRVAANMKYYHVFVIDLANHSVIMLDLPEEQKHVRNVCFSSDSLHVVAHIECQMCTWNALNGHIVSTKGFPGQIHIICPAPTSSIVATATKDNNKIAVWDINRLEESDKNPVLIYKNPVNTMLVSPQKRLAFVKTYKRLDSYKGYHYVDYFGLDVWELDSFKHQAFLPFGQHGSLKHQITSPDGNLIALCTEQHENSHVYLIEIASGKLKSHIVVEPQVSNLQISATGEYIIVEGTKPQALKLYNTVSSSLLTSVPDASNGVFSFDSKFAFWSQGYQIYEYSLATNSIERSSCCLRKVSKLQCAPGLHDKLVSTHGSGSHCIAICLHSIPDLKKLRIFKFLPSNGFLDFSKNGCYAVDGQVNVYNLQEMSVVSKTPEEALKNRELSLVRLTDSGCHAIWSDTQPVDCIKAFNIRSKTITAVVSTHSEVLSLCLSNGGFKVLAGCADGHFLALGLHSKSASSDNLKAAADEDVDLNRPSKWGLLQMTATNAASIDPIFHMDDQDDKETAPVLPVCSEEVHDLMVKNTKKVHKITQDVVEKAKDQTLNGSDSATRKQSSNLCTLF